MILRTGNESVAALDAMNKAVLHQKIQRTINSDGRGARGLSRQALDDLIGSERAMSGEQSLEYLSSDRRQILAARATNPFSVRQSIGRTTDVIVIGCGKDRL